MNTIVKIFRFVLILVLTISIISLVFINIASSTILSKDYILGKLDETYYYMDIREELESNFENYVGQSGLDEEVFHNIITEEKIKEEIKHQKEHHAEDEFVDKCLEAAAKKIGRASCRERV